MGVAGHFHFAQDIVQSPFQPGRHCIGLLIDRLTGNQFQAGGSGDGGQGIGVKGAGMIDPLAVVPFRVAAMGNHIHNFRLAADGPAGQRPGHDFSHRGQIRADAIQNLRPAGGGPETGDHFVENQHDPVLGGQLPHAPQVVRNIKGQLAVVGAGRLQNQGGDIGVPVQGVRYGV